MRTKHQILSDVVPTPLSRKVHERAIAEVSDAVTREMLQRLKNNQTDQGKDELNLPVDLVPESVSI